MDLLFYCLLRISWLLSTNKSTKVFISKYYLFPYIIRCEINCMYANQLIVHSIPKHPFLIYLCIILQSLTLLYVGLVLRTLTYNVTTFLQLSFYIPHKYLCLDTFVCNYRHKLTAFFIFQTWLLSTFFVFANFQYHGKN